MNLKLPLTVLKFNFKRQSVLQEGLFLLITKCEVIW